MTTDVIVIGGGHNGLVAAAYIARAGLPTLVLERRDRVGGAAVTEEFHPGFRAPTVAHLAGPLRPSILRDLGLRVATLEPEPRVYAPRPDGPGLRLFGDPERTSAEIAPLSARDADRYPEFHAALVRVGRVLSRIAEATPPDVSRPALGDLLPLVRVAVGIRALGRADAENLLRWGPMAVADFAGEWFENDLLRAMVAARGIIGSFAGPWSGGTTAPLLLNAALTGGGGAGSTVAVRGGVGAISEALADAARRSGARIRTEAQVERILVTNGRASGVVLSDGEEIPARAVVSGAHPKTTFLSLLDPALLDPEDARRARGYQTTGMASKVNLALSGLPEFTSLRGRDPRESLGGRIHIGPSVDEMERAFDDAKHGEISRRPCMEITIPSILDPELVPPGAHVLSAYVQYTPYRLRHGGWEERREEVAEAVLGTLEEYAPAIRQAVVARQVLSPLDLERTYALVGGHPNHGEQSLNQLFVARPLLGFARYRGPIEGLYLCGAGAHPGGGLTGAPGRNAAREVLKDLR